MIYPFKFKDQNELAHVMTTVCEFYSTTYAAINIKSRKNPAMNVRQVCMMFLIDSCKITHKMAADIFNLDRSTAHHAFKVIGLRYQTERDTRFDIDRLMIFLNYTESEKKALINKLIVKKA